MPARDRTAVDRPPVVWITGAARGIGLACARAFHAAGFRIVGVDRSATPDLVEIAAAVRELDVSDSYAVSRFSVGMQDAGLAPDVLVNNAGVSDDAVVWKLTEAQWDRVLDVCLKGAFNFTRVAVPLMRTAGRGGAIVNISSINGIRGKFGQSNYAAAKAGLIGFTKATAREVGAFGIRVNAVAPGMVDTDMARVLPADVLERARGETVLGRIAGPEDVAEAVLFLAGSGARHVTGQVLNVDGGQCM